MPLSPEMRRRIEDETRAYLDWAERLSRNDPDLAIYYEGDVRRKFPWWRRLLKV